MNQFKFIVQTKGKTEIIYQEAHNLYEAKTKFNRLNERKSSPSKVLRIEFQHNGVWFNQ